MKSWRCLLRAGTNDTTCRRKLIGWYITKADRPNCQNNTSYCEQNRQCFSIRRTRQWQLFSGCPRMFSVAVAFPAKLVHWSTLHPQTSSFSFRLLLFSLKPLCFTVLSAQEEKAQEKHYASQTDIELSFFGAVKLRWETLTTVVIMKLRSRIMWPLIMMEHSWAKLRDDTISIV